MSSGVLPASEEPTQEPTGEPTTGPTGEPTQEPTAPVPTATVTVTTTAEPVERDLYSTPGFHTVNGRWWHTECEPYSQTIRCTTEIWGTTVQEVGGGRFVQSTGWTFNNLTYLPHMTRAQWAANPLGHTGQWVADDGRRWRTECDTTATGRNGCRSYTWRSFVASAQASDGSWSHHWTQGWGFNNMVRFKTD